MTYRLTYYPEIKKDISKIPLNIKKRIKTAIEQRLADDPLKFASPLRRSLQGYYKLRVGNYRIICLIKKKEVLILKIGHRKEVYENLK